MSDWLGFAAFARERHHVVHVADGLPFGISRGMLRRRVREEGWENPYPGIVVTPGGGGFTTAAAAALRSLDTPRSHRAAVTALGFRSAAHVHGFFDLVPPLVEVVRNRGAGSPPRAGASVRVSRTLRPDDVVSVHGLPCTRPARTIRDLSLRLDEAGLRGTLLCALQRRACGLDEVEGYLPTLLRTAAHGRLRTVLDQVRTTPVDSAFEYDVVEAARARGLRPVVNFPWVCPDGRVIHLDLAFPEQWVAAECDGRGKYASDRTFSSDRLRWSQASPSWTLQWIDRPRWDRSSEEILDELCRRVYSADPRRPPAQLANCECEGCRRRGYAPSVRRGRPLTRR